MASAPSARCPLAPTCRRGCGAADATVATWTRDSGVAEAPSGIVRELAERLAGSPRSATIASMASPHSSPASRRRVAAQVDGRRSLRRSQSWMKVAASATGAPQEMVHLLGSLYTPAMLLMERGFVGQACLARACADDGAVGCRNVSWIPAVVRKLGAVDGATGMATYVSDRVGGHPDHRAGGGRGSEEASLWGCECELEFPKRMNIEGGGVRIDRGCKQGAPESTTLWNLVLDEALEGVIKGWQQ